MCVAKTAKGNWCGNMAKEGRKYCHVHAGNAIRECFPAVGIGAVLGHLVAPGIGGAVVGGAVSLFINKLIDGEDIMVKKKVFVSFDFDNDKALKDFIIGQSKLVDSPFSVADHSLKEAAPEKDWKDKARAAIKRSDIVLVMVGPKTSRALGVLAEVQMAREEGVPIVQIIGYKDGNYIAVPNAGRLYAWNWMNLKKLLG